MNECYLTTVWHTGTQYFKKGLEDHYRVSHSHLNDSVLDQVLGYKEVFTTYRDPFSVAASWANRGRFNQDRPRYGEWVHQWQCYRELLRLNPKILDFTKSNIQYCIDFGDKPINSHPDKLGLHAAIDNDNHHLIYDIIPKELIDYAIECSTGYNLVWEGKYA